MVGDYCMIAFKLRELECVCGGALGGGGDGGCQHRKSRMALRTQERFKDNRGGCIEGTIHCNGEHLQP